MEDVIDLPPGFRFHPTDEEIITHYLTQKVMNNNFSARAIGEVDMNKFEPWDLPKKAKMGEKEWYFFCQRDRKYPTGMRTNRATDAGYWKATGKDKEIYKGKNCLVGMKKTLVFYRGRAPKGEKTNWVMHEYRLEGKFSYHSFPKTAKDGWVVSRVFHKSTGIKKSPILDMLRMNSFDQNDLFDSSPSLPPLLDLPNYFNTNRPSSSFIDNEGKFNGTMSTSTSGMRMSDGNQLSYSMGMGDYDQNDNKNFFISNNYTITNNQGNPNNTPQNSIYYPQNSLPNPLLSYQASSNSGYLHQEMNNNSVPRYNGPDQAILRDLGATHDNYGLKRQCKVEQFSSNHSMVSHSQETGLSADINTEISSVLSKQDMGSTRSYGDLEVPSSSGPVVDLECLWNY